MTGSTPGPAPQTEDGSSLARTHLVGVGGAGMSGIARILVDRGLPVSGSDAKDSHVLTGLARRGVRTAIGHDAAHLDLLEGGPTAVVVSTAIRPTNPEVVAARDRGIPVVLRAEALAALMAGSRSVCVAGTHGKTSTTSMLTVALQRCGLDPSFMIGGELNESGSGAHQGSGDIFVAEADESDGSFLAFTPHGAVVTNLEPDHLDHHGTAEAYAAVFEQFVDRIAAGGFLVACTDDPGVRRLIAAVGHGPGAPRVITFGFAGRPDYLVGSHSSIGHSIAATITVPGGGTVPLTLAVPGVHMLSNATGALAAGIALGVPAQQMAAGLAGYTGVRRRFEYRGREAGVTVYDDYAHHPTEVAAQLLAARAVLDGDRPREVETRDAATDPVVAMLPGAGTPSSVGAAGGSPAGRLVVVFQPHLYSRTVTFAAEFARALAAADVVVVLDVYGAREDPRPGVTGELISRQVPPGPQVHFLPSLAAVPTQVAALTLPGDLVVTMGAGDVTMIGPQLLEVLAHR